MRVTRDLSLPAVVAAFVAVLVAVLVGTTSSAARVFEAARTGGADQAETARWLSTLPIGCRSAHNARGHHW